MSTTTDPRSAITVADLTKTYRARDREVRALDGVGFTVDAGTVLGLLGPNGAGKSTVVKILTTLSQADSGTATVAGYDVRRDGRHVRRAIGYVSQKPGFDPLGTGVENLVLSGRIYGMSPRASRGRAEELLERFGLADAGRRLARTWSGGMQRKLDVAMSLVHRPHVLFLDEPTTGLDPEARADLWAEISRLASDDGLTVLLTTHYLEEADHLAQRLVIVDHGRVVVSGTPEALKRGLSGDAIAVDLADRDDADRAVGILGRLGGVRELTRDVGTLRARVDDGAAALPPVMAALDAAGLRLAAVTVSRPSLDDVYLRYAGRSFAAAAESAASRPDGTGPDGTSAEVAA
ncbi:ATP-binding cassette domain-containing protein [Mumia sp. zg.B53]|uniref:ATP-binding cassette domain-containing protein n=1 Tax=unclassified Mumia TaxID=2621872 RepID=UPI001C6F14FA|nr:MULTISPECIES: ATP-binding cassette domain-containing protein [unclassified Mumia]MBW9213781.1 ATP-binding cassette domain-containing protein [Mumia sp. zg.B53]MDD9347361.1 ATP-binding cassette domain-containing protein [Mumia sp.]